MLGHALSSSCPHSRPSPAGGVDAKSLALYAKETMVDVRCDCPVAEMLYLKRCRQNVDFVDAVVVIHVESSFDFGMVL